jgi:hypothetical protein
MLWVFFVCALRAPFVAIHLDLQVEAPPVHRWRMTDCDVGVYFGVPLLMWGELKLRVHESEILCNTLDLYNSESDVVFGVELCFCLQCAKVLGEFVGFVA